MRRQKKPCLWSGEVDAERIYSCDLTVSLVYDKQRGQKIGRFRTAAYSMRPEIGKQSRINACLTEKFVYTGERSQISPLTSEDAVMRTAVRIVLADAFGDHEHDFKREPPSW